MVKCGTLGVLASVVLLMFAACSETDRTGKILERLREGDPPVGTPLPPPLPPPKYTQAEAIVLVQSHLQKTVVGFGDTSTTNCMDKIAYYLRGVTWSASWASDVWTVRATEEGSAYVFSWALHEKLGIVGLAQVDQTGKESTGKESAFRTAERAAGRATGC